MYSRTAMLPTLDSTNYGRRYKVKNSFLRHSRPLYRGRYRRLGSYHQAAFLAPIDLCLASAFSFLSLSLWLKQERDYLFE